MTLGSGNRLTGEPVPPSPVKRYRGLLAAFSISILFMLVYYVAQAAAQLGYTVALSLSEAYSTVFSDGFQLSDLQIDTYGILERIEQDYAIIASIYGVALSLAYLAFIRIRKRTQAGYAAFNRPEWKQLLAGIAIAIGMLGTANGLFTVLTRIAEQSQGIQSLLDRYSQAVGEVFAIDAASLPWMIIGICILVPIAEELLFRGIIQGEMAAVMPVWAAILVQALLFSVFHMQAVQSLYVFIPGLAMGAVYAATRSLVIPILMHMLFNFFGSGVFLSLMEDVPGTDIVFFFVQYVFILVGILAFVWLLRNRVGRSPPAESAEAAAREID